MSRPQDTDMFYEYLRRSSKIHCSTEKKMTQPNLRGRIWLVRQFQG